MVDPFAPSYYKDEEEYDLDKFINDYSDILNAQSGLVPIDKKLQPPKIEDPFKGQSTIPLGITDEQLWGKDGPPPEMFKSMNRADLGGMIRASNPSLYNNYSDRELIRMAKMKGLDADNLLFDEQVGYADRAKKGIGSFYDNSVKNVPPNLIATGANIMDKFKETKEWLGIGGLSSGIEWDDVIGYAAEIVDKNNKAYEQKIANDPTLRAWLRWGENNPLDWDNWYDTRKLTDIAFSSAPSYGTSIAMSTLAAMSGAGPIGAGAVMFGTTYSLEGAGTWAANIQELMSDVDISQQDFNKDVEDYKSTINRQLTRGLDADNVDYLKDPEMTQDKWSKLPAVAKRDYIDARTNNFVKENYKIENGNYTRKGLTAEQAGVASISTANVYAMTSAAIEILPGMAQVSKLTGGLHRAANAFKSIGKSKQVANKMKMIPGRDWNLYGLENWGWMRLSTLEGLEEFTQYGAEVLTTTNMPYKDPDTGGWNYGVSRENFAEKWSWSEAMEGFLGGFLTSGTVGFSSNFMKATGQFTGATDRITNFITDKVKREENTFFAKKNKLGETVLAFHYKDDKGNWQTKEMAKDDLADYVPEKYTKFSDAVGVAKALNENYQKLTKELDFQTYGAFHNATYVIENNDKKEPVLKWSNSAGELFAEMNLKTQKNDDGSVGLTKSQAIKRANAMIAYADALSKEVEGTQLLEDSGFVPTKGKDSGGPVVRWTPGEVITEETENSELEQAVKSAISGKPSVKSGPIVSDTKTRPIVDTSSSDADSDVLPTPKTTGSTSLKVRLFMGDRVTENEQDEAQNVSDSGVLEDFNEMKKEISKYGSKKEFEEDTGVKFDSFVNEMSQVFTGEDALTEDLFIQQQEQEIEQESKDIDPEPKVSKTKKKKSYADWKTEDLESTLKEIEEAEKGAKSAGGKGMLKVRKDAVLKELNKRKKPVQKKITLKRKEEFDRLNKDLDKKLGPANMDLIVARETGTAKEVENAEKSIDAILKAKDLLRVNQEIEILTEQRNEFGYIEQGKKPSKKDLSKIVSLKKQALKLEKELKKSNVIQKKTVVKPKSNTEVSIDEVKNILNKLSDKFTMLNGNIKVVEFDPENTDHQLYAVNNMVDMNNDAGWYDPNQNIIYVQPKLIAKRALDTPFHEFMHPFITQLRLSNPKLFKSLYEQLKETEFGKSVIEDTVNSEEYSHLPLEMRLEEAVVEAIGRMAKKSYANKLKKDEEASNWLKRLFQWVKEFIFGKSKAINVYVRPWELDQNTTISQISEMLADLDGIYKFELVDYTVQEDVLSDIKKQAGMEGSVVEEIETSSLIDDPNFNMKSFENLDGREYVAAHKALILEVGTLYSDAMGNVFDANKDIRRVYFNEGNENIQKTVNIVLDNFLTNFDKILNQKFKLAKKSYKPSKKNLKKQRVYALDLAEMFTNRYVNNNNFPVLSGMTNDISRAKSKLLKDRLIEKLDSQEVKNKLDKIGLKINEYVEKVKFNYTFLKIMSQKTGKININQLPTGHGGMSMSKAEQDIVNNEFTPFLNKNFKDIKSLDIDVIKNEYQMFMENKYGIIKYVGHGYDYSLAHEEFYTNALKPYDDGKLNRELVKTSRILFSDGGFYKAGHSFDIPGQVKGAGAEKTGAIFWFGIDVAQNPDGTKDITGFEFQSDFLDHVKKVSKYTNNFGKKEVTFEQEQQEAKYDDFMADRYRDIMNYSKQGQIIKGLDWMHTYANNPGQAQFFSVLFETLDKELKGELLHNEISLLFEHFDKIVSGEITQERTLYPWENTDSPLAEYGMQVVVGNQVVNGKIKSENIKEHKRQIKENKLILVPQRWLMGLLKKDNIEKIISSYVSIKHSFNSRQKNISRNINIDYTYKAMSHIFDLLKNGTNENRLLVRDIFQKINKFEAGDYTIAHQELGKLIMQIPGLTKAIGKTVRLSQLGMKEFSVSDLSMSLKLHDKNFVQLTEDGDRFNFGTFIQYAVNYNSLSAAQTKGNYRKEGLILNDGSLNPDYTKFVKTGREGGRFYPEENPEVEMMAEGMGEQNMLGGYAYSDFIGSLNQLISYYYKERNANFNKRKLTKQKDESFTRDFMIPFEGLLNKFNPAAFNMNKIFGPRLDMDYLKINLKDEQLKEVKDFLYKYWLRRAQSMASDDYRMFSQLLSVLKRFDVKESRIKEQEPDKTIEYDESNWMDYFKLNEKDVALNKKWSNLYTKHFERSIRLWMLEAQKYNGKSYLMLGSNHTTLGNGGASIIYETPNEAALKFLFAGYKNNLHIGIYNGVDNIDNIDYLKEIKDNFTELEINFINAVLANHVKLRNEERIDSVLNYNSLTNPDVLRNFMSEVYNLSGDALIDYGLKDAGEIYTDLTNLALSVVKKMKNNLQNEQLDSINSELYNVNLVGGPFFKSLLKVAKKENIKLSYEVPANGKQVLLRVNLEDSNSENLKPLYLKRLKKEQLNLFNPVTEEQVLDKVDTYIKDYHLTNVMDANTMFKNILSDFKVVALNRYGINAIDVNLFKSAMLKQLTSYPDLKVNFISWYDDFFASHPEVKAEKKLGQSTEEYGIEDNLVDDYHYSLSEIFEDFKELGRFDDVLSGKNSNENYQNLLDFAWLKELGVNIKESAYKRLIIRARNSESFKDFMGGKDKKDIGLKMIVGRTRFNQDEVKKFKKFWNRIRSNISVNNKNADRKNWWVIKTQKKFGEPQSIGPVVRKGVDNVIKKKNNSQFERMNIFEKNEQKFPNVLEWIGRSDVFSKKRLTDQQLINNERAETTEAYDYFRKEELPDLNKSFNKENRTIAFLRGDSKKMAVVKIHPGHYELAKDRDKLKTYWENEQKDGFIPNDDKGTQMIEELMSYNTSPIELAENIARHAALKVVWPKHKHYTAATLMKRIKIATTPGTFADELRDFTAMAFNPVNVTLVKPDGTTRSLMQNIPGVGLKYIYDGATFIGRSFNNDYNVAHGLSNDNIESKTAIYQKDGLSTIMIKHNSFLVDKDMELYENYGKPNQRLVAKVENYVIKTPDDIVIDILGTPDEFKIMDDYNLEESITLKGTSAVTPFYTEQKSKKATHGMQHYNYFDDSNSIYDLWNPQDGQLALSIQRSMSKLFNMGLATNRKSSQDKISDFLEQVIGNDADGFLPTVLEHAKLGSGFHPVSSNALDKLVQTRILNPALNLKGRSGAKLIIRPNTAGNFGRKEISIPFHALGPIVAKIAIKYNIKQKDVDIQMANNYLETETEKVLVYRTPIASIKGAGAYKIVSVHNQKNVIMMNETDIYYDLEADHDGDKVQIEHFSGQFILTNMQNHIDNTDFTRHDLSKFVPENYESSFNMTSSDGLFGLIGALVSGQNGLGEIAKAASVYGILNTWFENMTINGRKVILTPKDYTLTWPTFYDGKNEWKGSLPEIMSIFLQASADNSEFMLLGKWNYSRNALYSMMFKYEDDMTNINEDDLKIVLAMMPVLRMPSNIRTGSDFTNGKYFASHTFEMSAEYSDFVADRTGYLKAKIESNKFIDSTLDAMEYNTSLHPLEIVAVAPNAMRGLSNYRNHIMTSSSFPLAVSDTMHINSHKAATNDLLDAVNVDRLINDAINRDGMSILSKQEKTQYIEEEYKKGFKYALAMKNDFIRVINKHSNANYSSMDREENMVKFKETHDRKFRNLSNLAKLHATLRFMEGFTTFDQAYKTKRGSVLRVLPPVSKSVKEYSLLDWRAMKSYYTSYNGFIRDKNSTIKGLQSSNKIAYTETIKKICRTL